MNVLISASCAILWLLPAIGDDEPEKAKLTMTPAVACSKVRGFGDYDAMEEAVLTRDDKLQLYFEVGEFAHDRDGKTREYRVHLVQDAKLRRRGQKAVIQSKEKLVDYAWKGKEAPEQVYLSNAISLKKLTPGEYDLEIILRDEIGKGPAATQVFKFRVKEAETPGDRAKDESDGKDEKARKDQAPGGSEVADKADSPSPR